MTKPTDLPLVIEAYYAASNNHDIDRLVACFAEDARVRDDGEDLVGRDAIRHWAIKARDNYNATSEVLSHDPKDGADFVTAKVSGTFPGSPIELTYRFGLKDGQIASLAIA